MNAFANCSILYPPGSPEQAIMTGLRKEEGQKCSWVVGRNESQKGSERERETLD